MSTMFKFNLTNQSAAPLSFYFFQEPAIYSGGSEVYSNSIQSTLLAPYSEQHSTFTFQVNMQFYAGVQQLNTPPAVGQQHGYLSAIVPIDLTLSPNDPSSQNATQFSLTPFGLSSPTNDPSAEPSSFRIVSPVFTPSLNTSYAGSAVSLGDGSVILSNYTQVLPNQNLDCQPVLKFYVQTGSYQQGTVMNFDSSSRTAAFCDATTGHNTFDITYNANGTWTVTPSTN